MDDAMKVAAVNQSTSKDGAVTAQPKRKYKTGRIRKDNEKQILAAAEKEFVLYGFKGTSIQKIADRVGLPKANVHYYFNNKETLYGALLEDIRERWDDSFDRFKADDDPKSVLTAFIQEKIEFSRDYPDASRIYAMEVISGGAHLNYLFESEYTSWFEDRVAVFQAWIDAEKMAPIAPEHLIYLLWSSTQHYADFSVQIAATQGKEVLDQDDFDQAIEFITSLVLKGCGLA